MSTTTAYPRRDIAKPERRIAIPCTRCDGVGGHVMWPNFTCFRCAGNKWDPTRKAWAFPADWDDDQCQQFLDCKQATAQRARERREAKRLAEWEAGRADREAAEAAALAEWEAHKVRMWAINVANCPELQTFVDHPSRAMFPDFCEDIAESAHNYELSPRQIAAFTRIVKRGPR
jgi:hypothetical protein